MSNDFELAAMVRSDVGKGASRRLRRTENLVPAILYGGTKDPINLSIEERILKKAFENEAFYSHVLDINVEGKKHKAVIKAIQRHPSKQRILHLDLQRVSAKEKINMRVPLHFVGEDLTPGAKQGGVISHQLTEVEVTCLPKDLPEYLEIDLSKLELDQAFHLSEMKLPAGVELVELTKGADHDLPVASVHKSRGKASSEEPMEIPEASDEEGKSEEGDK